MIYHVVNYSMKIFIMHSFFYGFCQSRSCTERSQISGAPKGLTEIPVQLMIATIGSDVKLPCHYCDEAVGINGRIWYRRDLNDVEKELQLDMHDDDAKNRRFVDKDHSLIIRGVGEDDGAYYQCRGVGNSTNSTVTKMDILLDVGYRSTLEPHVIEKLAPLRMYSCYVEWSPWGKCDTCGKIGKRRRIGECRLQKLVKAKVEISGGKEVEADFPIVGVGCHSVLLNAVPPAKEILRKIPNIVLLDKCEVSCENFIATATEMTVYKKSSFLKKMKVKAMKAIKAAKQTVTAEERQHPEGESITLFCPGSDLDTRVKWKFQNKVLRPAKVKESTSGRITIDVLDTVHIKELRLTDAGEYVCSLDGVEIGLVRLRVVAKYTVFDPTSNFGILTIVMILSFLFWIILMAMKWKYFQLQQEVQERRAMRKYVQREEDEVETQNLLDESV